MDAETPMARPHYESVFEGLCQQADLYSAVETHPMHGQINSLASLLAGRFIKYARTESRGSTAADVLAALGNYLGFAGPSRKTVALGNGLVEALASEM